MPITLQDKLVVAISSRALFDFEEENRAFEAADDTWRSSWAPEDGLSDEIDAEGLGDALRALAAARRDARP